VLVIYIDNQTKEAKVHKDTCRYFRTRKGNRVETGYWVQGFEKLGAALAYARQTAESRATKCLVCSP